MKTIITPASAKASEAAANATYNRPRRYTENEVAEIMVLAMQQHGIAPDVAARHGVAWELPSGDFAVVERNRQGEEEFRLVDNAEELN